MIAPLREPKVDAAHLERRAMLRWTTIIVGMLLFGIVTSVTGALVAMHGKPMVEDDYYSKALHWDDQMALEQASIALGWKTELSVGSDATAGGDRALMLRLTGKDGMPIDDAHVSVAFFHRADPLNLVQIELKATGDGMYAASASINRAGIWEFRVTIHHAATGQRSGAPIDEMFVQSLKRDLLE